MSAFSMAPAFIVRPFVESASMSPVEAVSTAVATFEEFPTIMLPSLTFVS